MYANNHKVKKASFFDTVKEIVFLLLIVFLVRTFVFGLYQVPTGSMQTTMLIGERFFADKMSYLFRKPERGEIIALNSPTFEYSTNPLIRLYQEYVGWPIWPMGPINLTKRIIGKPGDHIKGVIEDGKPVVYLNDAKLDEKYLNRFPLIATWSEEGRGAHIDWRAFDPSKGLAEQEFHRVNPKLLVTERQFNQLPAWVKDVLTPGLTISAQGYLLEEPGKPIDVYEKKMQRQGQSYWTDSDEFDVYLSPTQYWLMGDNRRGSQDSRSFGPVEERLIHGRILYRIWSIDSDYSWWIVDLLFHPIDFFKRMRWHRFFQKVE